MLSERSSADSIRTTENREPNTVAFTECIYGDLEKLTTVRLSI